jgi:hypothetical protein
MPSMLYMISPVFNLTKLHLLTKTSLTILYTLHIIVSISMRCDNIDIVSSSNDRVFKDLNFHSTQLLLDMYDQNIDAIAKEINQDV